MIEQHTILVTSTRDSANQLIQILRKQAEFKDIKVWAEDWRPIGVRIEARTDEQTARKMTLFLNKFLGYA